MKIAVPAETEKTEPRVAATPETVKKFIGLGAEVSCDTCEWLHEASAFLRTHRHKT